MTQHYVNDERAPADLPPPRGQVGVVGWMQANLFSTWYDALLSLLAIAGIAWYLPPLLQWAVFDATIAGTTRDACEAVDGACWTFIKVRFSQFLYGFYPLEERWRVDLGFGIVVLMAIPLFMKRFRFQLQLAALIVLAFPFIAYFLFHGGWFGLPVVETRLWGGLFLTLVISITGIGASLPLGILLALGRRSDMPVIKGFCVVFIEFWRGVPLITVLFMASVMFPLFLPEGMNFDKLLRALIGVALFASAYMAEVVRGGLQAIPRGQSEAAQALGLGYWQAIGLVILPQALKLVIPGIVNTFIGLFKDTTLVLIIGLFDLLGIVQAAATDPEWLGFSVEGYVFAAFGFWIFCFGMSRYSMAVERKLETGHRS